MNIEIILSIITALSGGGFLGMLFERRKRKAETSIIEADFNERVRDMYLKFVEDFDQKYEKLQTELEAIHKQNEELKKQNEELKKQNIELINLLKKHQNETKSTQFK